MLTLAAVTLMAGCSTANEVESQIFDSPGYTYESHFISFSREDHLHLLAYAIETPKTLNANVMVHIQFTQSGFIAPRPQRSPDLLIHDDRVEIIVPADQNKYHGLELPEPHEPVNDIAVLSRNVLRQRVALWLSQEDRGERRVLIPVEQIKFDNPRPGTPEAEDFVIRLDADRSNFVLFAFLDPQAERLLQALSGPE